MGRHIGVHFAAVAVAFLCAAFAACGGPPPAPRKVVVVGIDGAEWAVVNRLREAGRVPTLHKLIADGTSGELGSLRPTRSPALWTTVATGMPAKTHGIENFVLFRPHVEFVLPGTVPPGDVELRLDVTVNPPCGNELLEVHVNRARLQGGRWAGARWTIPVPGALRRSDEDVVALRLPPRCAPAPEKKQQAARRPWGALAGAVVRSNGTDVATLTPRALAGEKNGIELGADGAALLTGVRLAQIESSDRQVPALWNIASARGLSVGVVGWWCTWPAEQVHGTMVSDVLFFASNRRLLNLDRVSEHALDAGAVYPPTAHGLLADALPEDWALTADELAYFVPRESARFGDYLEMPSRVGSLDDPPLVILKDTYLLNRPYFSIARHFAETEQPDLLMVYTNLVDAVEHKFWRYYEPERFPAVDRTEVEDFGDTIPRVYDFVDAELGALLSSLAPDTTVLVISDHGHHAAPDDGVFSGAHADAPPGVLVAAGPDIRRGARVDGATLYDIAPTVLALLGLPVADDMPGSLLERLFTTPPDPERIATYADLSWRAGEAIAGSAVDTSVRERLRALGYLE